MNSSEKTEYVKNISIYMEKNKIYSIFENLYKSLIMEKPKKPLQFLIEKIKFKSKKRIFIIGPPGSKIKEVALKLSHHFKATMISIGDLLKKEVIKKTDLGQKIEEYLKNYLYVPDSIVVEVLIKYMKTLKDNDNIIIEGFPKTIYQAKYLVNKNIIPDSLIFLNYKENGKENLLEKFKETNYNEEPVEDLEERADNYFNLYKFHLDQCKQVFRKIALEFDIGDDNNKLEDLAKLIRYKLRKGFQNTLKFVIYGNNSKKKEKMVEKFSSTFGVKYINPILLIKGEIKRKNKISHEILDYFEKGQKIPISLIYDLIVKRIERIDVQLNGYLLDLTGMNKKIIELISNKYLDINFSIFINDGDNKKIEGKENIENLVFCEDFFGEKEFKEFVKGNERCVTIGRNDCVDKSISKIIFEATHILE